MIIGLGHYSRTGKDTLARFFVSAAQQRGLNAARVGFADALKDTAYRLYGWAGLQERVFYEDPRNEHLRDKKLEPLGLTPVELWVAFGNKIREVHKDTWIELVLDRAANVHDHVIIPDVRFPNEAYMIKDRGGILVKVVRPGVRPRNTPSDTALVGFDGWDYITGGSGEITELMLFGEQLALYCQRCEWPPQPETSRQKQLTQEQHGLRGVPHGV